MFQCLLDTLLGKMKSIKVTVKIFYHKFLALPARIITLPYYRLYFFNTSQPLHNIARLASQGSQDDTGLLKVVALWRDRKLAELQFISISCTVLAAAPIGAFSWTTIEEAHWLTPGFWYGSLIMSILGILISASEVTVLHILGPLPTTGRQRKAVAVLGRYTSMLLSKESGSSSEYVARKKMIFVWQCPLMFMSYSVCGFLAGLTTLVCTPLWNRHKNWNDRCNIAVMYLTICGISGTAFVLSSFWIYHYIDLTFEEDQTGHEDSIDTDNEC